MSSLRGSLQTAEKLPITVRTIVYVSFEKPFLLAITEENGILITEDNGLTWKEFNNGFNKDDGAYSVYTSNSDIFVGSWGCIYHLKNGADSWNKIDILKNDSKAVAGINGIYPLGQDKGFIITEINGKIIYVDKDLNQIGLNYGVMHHSKILAVNKGITDGQKRIYAFVANNNYIDIDRYGLFYSSDNGKTWNKSLIYGREYRWDPDLYISPHDNNEIWVFDYENSGFNTFDGGKTWKSFNLGLGFSAVYDFVFDPIDKNTKYICAGVNGSWLRKYKKTGTEGQWTNLEIQAKRLSVNKDDNKFW